MIDHNHPAVEAAMKSTALDTLLIDLRPRLGQRKRVAHLLAWFITAALPHLTADDLRDTPAGRALMAEAWQEGAMAHASATSRMTPDVRRIINNLMAAANPYEETPDE